MMTRERSRTTLGAFMVGMGVLHFAVPKAFDPLIPEQLGDPRPWVLGSGVAELVAGGLVLCPPTSRLGAAATAAVMVGVFPGNIKMALDAGPPRDLPSTAAWLRLPVQVPLIRWALRHARTEAPEGA